MRDSLIEHPAESNITLDLMSEASDLLVAGQLDDARKRIVEADIRSLCEWFHHKAQRTTVALRRHGIGRSELPTPPKEQSGHASDYTKHAVFLRDGWHLSIL